jgi:hypothetical protein
MRHGWWLWVVMVACLTAGCGGEPIVGKWEMESPVGKQGIQFDSNGNGKLDLTGLEQRMKEVGAGPLAKQAQAALDRLKQTKTTWKKEGKLYRIASQVPGMPAQPPSFVKVEGDKLQFCKPDGTATGRAMTRAK